MLSAARASSPQGLLIKATALVVVAVALVVPARGSHGRPPAPIELEVVRTTPSAITWRWGEPRALSAATYRVFVDGRFVTSTTATGYTVDGLRCGTAYTLGVEAVAATGDSSARASVIAATAPCPPTTTKSPPAKVEHPVPEHPAVPAPPPMSAPWTPEVPSAPVSPVHEEPASLWTMAGAFVWHETAVDPEALGAQLRDNGFGWVAVLLHDGLEVDPVEGDWVRRFRDASGLAVGGWGVLRTQPEHEAAVAQSLVEQYSLDFYIANAEAEYKYTGDHGTSDVRFQRSREFVEAFREALPDLPAAVSSYCAPARQDIDWGVWNAAGFDFLPQAYVNDFGDAATPAECTKAAAEFFPAEAVHPTIGVYRGQGDEVAADQYVSLLQEAGTVGFSVYLAETRMHSAEWNALGQIIRGGLARRPGEEVEAQAPPPAGVS